MRKFFILIISILLISSCYAHRYPNGDGTMTVVEYNIFKKDSTILYGVRCPIDYSGRVISSVKGHHYVGVPGKGGHSVTHFDIEVRYYDVNGQYKVYKDRICRSDHDLIQKRGGYVTIHEEFYPYHRVYPKYR